MKNPYAKKERLVQRDRGSKNNGIFFHLFICSLYWLTWGNLGKLLAKDLNHKRQSQFVLYYFMAAIGLQVLQTDFTGL